MEKGIVKQKLESLINAYAWVEGEIAAAANRRIIINRELEEFQAKRSDLLDELGKFVASLYLEEINHDRLSDNRNELGAGAGTDPDWEA